MPRRKANVNLTDTRRFLRAAKLENVPFKATLQPGGAVVFEPAAESADEPNVDKAETSEDVRKLL
jgi:hypothetical protein